MPPGEETWRAPAPTSLGRADVLLTLATTLLWAMGSFTFFTYIGVVLHRTASVGAAGLAGFLLLFGLAGIGGTALAGWLTDDGHAQLHLTLTFDELALIYTSLEPVKTLRRCHHKTSF